MEQYAVQRKKTSPIVYFTIFIYLLMQNRCWIGFGGRTFIMTYVLICLLLVFGLVGAVKYQINKSYLWFAFLVFVSNFYSMKGWGMNLNGLISLVVPAVNILFILSIPDADKDDFLHYIVKWFGLIMIPSIILYFFSFWVSWPGFGVLEADYGSRVFEGHHYINYLFYIKPMDFLDTDLMRFNGPFLEPGDIGCAAAFLLFAAKFNFKEYKYLWAVLASLIVSLSLAGWMLGIMGFLLTLFSNARLKGRGVVLSVTLLWGIYIFGNTVNGGDNVVNNAILSRLQADDDFGFTGNHRTSLLTQAYFLEMFNTPQTALFGYDRSTLEKLSDDLGGSAGFVAQAVRVGMVGMILLVLPYLHITLISKDRRYGWSFFILLLGFLFQRTGVFWIIFVITYVYGIVINDRNRIQTS